jgi:TetR/AcrR family transcriptional repressor of bet genes
MGRRSNRAERRQQIAAALLEVMAERGYEGASIHDVAEAAGLTPGLVHYHFETKLEILLALVERLRADHSGRLIAAVAAADDDPRRELSAIIDLLLVRRPEQSDAVLPFWIAVTSEALQKEPVRAEVAGALDDVVILIRRAIAKGQARHVFHPTDGDAAAAALLSLIQGYFVVAATARALVPPGSAAASAKAMMRGILRAAEDLP